MRRAALFAFVAAAAPALAESLVATRTIRAKEILGPADLAVSEAVFPGALQDPLSAIGLETRVTIYAGRPVLAANLAPAALVDRNDRVSLEFGDGRLRIRTEGRAMDRGGQGHRIRVMNLTSRITVTGTVIGPGRVSVP